MIAGDDFKTAVNTQMSTDFGTVAVTHTTIDETAPEWASDPTAVPGTTTITITGTLQSAGGYVYCATNEGVGAATTTDQTDVAATANDSNDTNTTTEAPKPKASVLTVNTVLEMENA